MAEMIGEFPDLHRTIVSERDVYLTYMLRQAARRLELPRSSDGEGAGRPGGPGAGGPGPGADAAERVLTGCPPHSRAQEVRPLRGGGRRGHGPRPRHREELDHRPQHPRDHDVSAARPERGAGLGRGLSAGDTRGRGRGPHPLSRTQPALPPPASPRRPSPAECPGWP